MTATYFALALFALTTIALAIYRRPTSDDDFLIRERKVGALETAAATFTLLGGGEFVTLTALTYFYGASRSAELRHPKRWPRQRCGSPATKLASWTEQ